MSQLYKVKAAPSLRLKDMSEDEVTKLVSAQADEMLSALPKHLRASGVNAIQLESSAAEIAGTGVWAQWTRACCDRRRRIEDFVYPADIEQLRIDPELGRKIKQDHFDTSFEVRQVTEKATLKRLKAATAKTRARKKKT